MTDTKKTPPKQDKALPLDELVKLALPGGADAPAVSVIPGGVMLTYPSAAAYSARTSRDMEALVKELPVVSSETVEPVQNPMLTSGGTHWCVRVRLSA